MSRGNLHNPEKVKVKISLIILQFEHETALVSLNFLENNGLSLRQKHSLLSREALRKMSEMRKLFLLLMRSNYQLFCGAIKNGRCDNLPSTYQLIRMKNT